MRIAVIIVALFIGQSVLAIDSGYDYGLEFQRDDKVHLNRRDKHPAGMNLYFFGAGGLANLTFDHFVTPKVAIELGGGIRNPEGDIGFLLGGRYHLLGNTFLNLTPYVGVYTAFHHNGKDLQNHSLYIPFGLHKIKKSGMTWSAEIAYESNVFENNHFSGGFRLGYRF